MRFLKKILELLFESSKLLSVNILIFISNVNQIKKEYHLIS